MVHLTESTRSSISPVLPVATESFIFDSGIFSHAFLWDRIAPMDLLETSGLSMNPKGDYIFAREEPLQPEPPPLKSSRSLLELSLSDPKAFSW